MKRFLKTLIYRMRGEYTTEQLIKKGMKVGKNFHRLNGVVLDPGHCWLITIGDNVTLAPRVHVLCHDASTKMFLGYTKIGNVSIGNNVFVGAESVILPNVKIGNNVIIGANSTVCNDIPDNTVVAGSPAIPISETDIYIEKMKKLMSENPCFEEEFTERGNIDKTKKSIMKETLECQGIGFVR